MKEALYGIILAITLALGPVAVTSHPQASLPSPLAIWTFNSTTADSSGNGNNATWNGTPAYTTGTLFANAASLDGTNSLSLGTTVFNTLTAGTWVLWIKPASTGAMEGSQPYEATTIIGIDGIYVGLFQTQANALRYYYYDGSPESYDSTSPLTVGSWQCIAAAWDASGSILYLNGTAVGSSTKTFTSTDAGHVGQPAYAGQQTAGWNFPGAVGPFTAYGAKLAPGSIAGCI